MNVYTQEMLKVAGLKDLVHMLPETPYHTSRLISSRLRSAGDAAGGRFQDLARKV